MFHSENEFQDYLDAHPDDYYSKAIFADWLDEQGENNRADGLRAMCACRLHGAEEYEGKLMPNMRTCWFVEHKCTEGLSNHHIVPEDWFFQIEGQNQSPKIMWTKDYLNRRSAEDALAVAFSRLPEDRRRELLAGIRKPTSATASS